jgi:hypothetical protein
MELNMNLATTATHNDQDVKTWFGFTNDHADVDPNQDETPSKSEKRLRNSGVVVQEPSE